MNQERLANSWQVLSPQEQEEDLFDYSYSIPGAAPGTLDIEPDAKPLEIVLIDYNQDTAIKTSNLSPQACLNYLNTESVSWFDILGLGNEAKWWELGKVFNLHPLLLEDVVNIPQRPKVENYQDQVLIITQMVMPKQREEGFWIEQISLVLGKGYLITVQEEPQRDCFQSIRDRILQNRGKIREYGADYLAYALWDAIIDGYFPVLEACEERIEDLEEDVLRSPNRKTLNQVYKIKRELLALRRLIWPQRNALYAMIRDESPLISPEVRIYLRDCYDHIVEIIDIIEIYRELVASLLDIYISAVGNKMNDIMKVLTVISTIFIPLTFIAGVYGMNFDPEASPWNMPELKWYFGYPLCLGVMVAIAGGLIYIFWRRGWFKSVASLK